MSFTRALVRRPAPNLADGLTTAGLGPPNLVLAIAQHGAYCEALKGCGLELTYLRIDPEFPDGTFVEDPAIVTSKGAILTRPGAPSRLGEVASVREGLSKFVPSIGEIEAPGTVDGGDVCETGGSYLIGLSERTNLEGARQLATILARHGYDSIEIDVRGIPGLLHLKSGLAALEDGRLVAVAALAGRDELRRYPSVVVDDDEAYAANCVGINGRVLLAGGFPVVEQRLRRLGYDVVTLDMSEFRKMDGGLSCLSLRL